jgi:hypothetical protein
VGIRAIAYHESVAMERLERHFQGEGASRSGTAATKCDKCKLNFAIVLPIHDHPDNAKYILRLTQIISDDRVSGRHHDEYMLESAN